MDAVATAATPAANGLADPASAVAAGPVQSVAAEQGAEGQSAGINTGTEASAGETNVVQDASAEPVVAQAEAAAPEPLPEPYTSLFKQAKETPTEFTTWTSLISAAEKLADIGRLRQVYDAFLAEYPLCYGYWKKYADAEAKYVSLEEASNVYDRGVAAVPYSVDLWGHYAVHKQKAGAPVEEVERLFERGLAYVGMDYLSHGLWDKYLAYELSLGAHAHIAQLYSRLLRMPIQRLDDYRTRFHEYSASHTAAELVPEQERTAIASRLAQQIRDEQAAQKAAAAEAAAAATAAQAAAQSSAATAAQAAANTDTAQAMDTTAGGDDAFDAVAQETVAAASNMAATPAAPAEATVADSTATDDAPAAPAGPDAAATQAPRVLSVPAPDDIAASVLAGVSEPATDAASVPTGTAPTTAPPAVDTSFPASVPAVGAALASPQDIPAAQLSAPSADTDMPQATIPQSDGPSDDPMEDIQAAPAVDSVDAVTAAGVQDSTAPAAAAAADPTAALATDPVANTLDPTVTAQDPTALATDSAVQAAEPGTASVVPDAPQVAAPAAAEPEITDEQIKSAWLSSVDEVYSVTKEEWSRRKPFEDAIKRPYFHVKPLDLAQLQNWSNYLDYIEEKKDIGMIIRLYERCLVACASYPDFWMRYVRWQEVSSKAAAQVALERATSVHCKRRPEIQLFAAHFHERHGNIDTARALFRLVTQRLSPTLISGAVQHANFERRQGSKAAACTVYDKFLEREASQESATYVFVVIQYVNALQWGFQDVEKAREVYNAAVKKAPGNLTLWEGIIHFEEHLPGADRLTHVLDIYSRAVEPSSAETAKSDTAASTQTAVSDAATNGMAEDIAATAAPATTATPPGLTTSERELLSNRAVDFVDMNGDANLLSKVEQQHAHRFKLPGKIATAPTSRKRGSEAIDSTANKAAKTAAAATPAASASYAAAGALPGPPAAGAAQASMSQAYYSSAAPYYQYPQAYPTAQQPYAYPAASAAGGASAYQYAGYYG